jgi:hypothetical protein
MQNHLPDFSLRTNFNGGERRRYEWVQKDMKDSIRVRESKCHKEFFLAPAD